VQVVLPPGHTKAKDETEAGNILLAEIMPPPPKWNVSNKQARRTTPLHAFGVHA